jgi:hypothetical protein
MLRSPDVQCDLRAQLIGRREFFFFAKPVPELHLDVLGRGNIVERVENMSFYGERGAVEGGTEANVGNRAARFSLAGQLRAGKSS